MISQSRRSIFDYTLAMSTFAKECLEGVRSMSRFAMRCFTWFGVNMPGPCCGGEIRE